LEAALLAACLVVVIEGGWDLKHEERAFLQALWALP
jgi:hypothetical protein